jgi:Asp-tRNA(Asn)/Glu-tRNA(Gln) amidotransferase B subunit
MVNKKLDSQFPEAGGLVAKVMELTSVKYADSAETQLAAQKVISGQQKAVTDYKNGKGEVVGFLIGMVQKELKGKGKVETIREILLKEIQK